MSFIVLLLIGNFWITYLVAGKNPPGLMVEIFWLGVVFAVGSSLGVIALVVREKFWPSPVTEEESNEEGKSS